MSQSYDTRTEQTAALLEKLAQKASVTDREVEQLQKHVDELERHEPDSVHHHEDQNLEE
jgi:hypothetical protein